jgi:hypothetical protein
VRREAANRVTINCWYQRRCGAVGVDSSTCAYLHPVISLGASSSFSAGKSYAKSSFSLAVNLPFTPHMDACAAKPSPLDSRSHQPASLPKTDSPAQSFTAAAGLTAAWYGEVSTRYSDAKVFANRNDMDFGWEISLTGPYATPADFSRHDDNPYRRLRVRRWGLGFVHHSRDPFSVAPIQTRYDSQLLHRSTRLLR